jgi:hypothetical protein
MADDYTPGAPPAPPPAPAPPEPARLALPDRGRWHFGTRAAEQSAYAAARAWLRVRAAVAPAAWLRVRDRWVGEGQPVPANVTPEQLAELERRGFVIVLSDAECAARGIA